MRLNDCLIFIVPHFCAFDAPRFAHSVFCFLLLFTITFPVVGKSIEQQRKEYLVAKKALEAGQYKTFAKISNTLKDYPLYPYLRYEYLRKRLQKVTDTEMLFFFKHHGDLPMVDSLRTAWLNLLIRRDRWQAFLDNYTTQSDPVMWCYQLQARMKTNHYKFLLEDILNVWLVGKSLPSQCDSAFELLYKSNLITNDLVWKRIQLAMQNNRLNLAKYLSKRLKPEYKALAQIWFNIHQNPQKYTKNVKLEDNETSRKILTYGVLRLARQDVEKAVKRLEKLKEKYSFSFSEMAEIERKLAIRAAKDKNPLAKQLLDNVDPNYINSEVFHYRLKVALADHDWPLLKKWTSGDISAEKIKLRWQYWYARALEETGENNEAVKIYAELATQRDYYGLLAADKINAPYQMNYYALPKNQEEIDRIASLPAIKRAYELYTLGFSYPARREWYHALKKMTPYQMQMAANLANQWGWHDRTIFTMTKARSYDDLVLRFPITFSDLLNKYAKKHDLDFSWVYGLVRAESAFIEDARSPVGALGLMQIMPRTGQMTAKSIGMKNFKPYKLKRAETNIRIGSAYMKKMLEKFDGNMVLATAAYNAGPHRVTNWLPKADCEKPDIWIEQIPFNETRKYVSRVLYFASIYDWRLKNKVKLLKDRMALVIPSKGGLVANLSCAKIELSDAGYVAN